jgi:hypothetical protein
MGKQPYFGLSLGNELLELPRWARAAFAARCARRVLPLYPGERSPATKSREDVAAGVQLAEVAAATGAVGENVAGALADFPLVADFPMAPASLTLPAATTGDRAADAARDAIATAATTTGAAELAAKIASRAANASAEAAANAVGEAARDAAVQAIQHDLQNLVRAAREQGWNDDTPVPIEFFGPLWPEGEPEGWPKLPEEESQVTGHLQATQEGNALDATGEVVESEESPPIELYIDVGDASEETVKELLVALSDLHVAAGGEGLVFSSDGTNVLPTEEGRR